MFTFNASSLPYEEALNELLRNNPHKELLCGIELNVEFTDSDSASLIYTEKSAHITCRDKVYIFRAVMNLCQQLSAHPNLSFTQTESAAFSSLGTMLDCSRNAVLTTDAIKKYIRLFAAAGMNTLMLYTEDTYEVSGYPYFGAYRGRYSHAELKECDDYADLFGIEIIPCIQTLAHLRTALRWPAMADLKDTEDILYVNKPSVLNFLTQLITAASAPFRSNKIHLGMDEAHNLGLGNYLSDNGYHTTCELMQLHLDSVKKLCDDLHLEPIIWSDMFFRINSPTGDYYNVASDCKITEKLMPQDGLHLMYWDYYHKDQEFYEHYLDLHRQMDPDCWFAGGGWIWNGLAPNYSKAMITIDASMKACRSKQQKRSILTLWQDNGAETPHSAGVLPILYFAEHGYQKEINSDAFSEKLLFMTGIPYETFLLIDRLDCHPLIPDHNMENCNPSKYCFYQDVLTGLFDKQIEGLSLSSYYEELSDRFAASLSPRGLWSQVGNSHAFFPCASLVVYYYKLTQFLTIKADLGIRLYNAYQNKQFRKLEMILEHDLPCSIELAHKVTKLREYLWFSECKPFGHEILDIRFHGVIARLEAAKRRIRSYLTHETECLEELEVPRIKFEEHTASPFISMNNWERIISASNITGI